MKTLLRKFLIAIKGVAEFLSFLILGIQLMFLNFSISGVIAFTVCITAGIFCLATACVDILEAD